MPPDLDWRLRTDALLRRMDEARTCYPTGTWAQRWVPGVCKHPTDQRRCVHGDEIIARGFARTVCLVCGRGLKKARMPRVCWFTGELHASAEPYVARRGGPLPPEET
jgi:hypothetical protein